MFTSETECIKLLISGWPAYCGGGGVPCIITSAGWCGGETGGGGQAQYSTGVKGAAKVGGGALLSPIGPRIVGGGPYGAKPAGAGAKWGAVSSVPPKIHKTKQN